MTSEARPPALAHWLLRLTLDAAAFEIVAGDLEEDWRFVATQMSARAARRRYWRLALASIAARWRAGRLQRPAPRESGGLRMETLFQDVRFGLRQMRRAPAVTAAAVVTLAVGLAAVTTVFGLINALVLRPLPYADPSRVTFVLGRDVATGDLLFNMRYRDALDVAASDAFEDVAVYRGFDGNLTGGGLPERVQAYHVSPNLFALLGVEARLGRVLDAGDAAGGGARVVVISHGLWMRRFGGDPAVVGRAIGLNGEPHVVVGVMPVAFQFPVFNFKGDLWAPLEVAPEWTSGARDRSPSVVAVARLAPGATVESARAAADAAMARLAQASPSTNARRGALVVPMGEMGREQTAPLLALLAAAGVLVLLVSCVNVANLLLARATSRGQELAVRAAIGAGRGRLVRQLLVESLVTAAAAGLLAVAFSRLALEALRGAMPEFLTRVLPGVEAIRADPAALGFAAAASLLTVLLFGLLPAWQASSARASDALRGGRVSTPPRRRLRRALVVAEVGLSVALLAMAVLLARSVRHLAAEDPGFDRDRLLALSVSLPESAYPDATARAGFFDRLTTRLASLPGVEAAGLVHPLPFSTSDAFVSFQVAGEPAAGQAPSAALRVITSGYFDAMGMRIEEGQAFAAADVLPAGRRVAIVNRAFVGRHLGDGAAVGRQLRLGTAATPFDIAGVVSDVRHASLADAAFPEVYLPYALSPRGTMTVTVRAAGDPAALAPAVRAELAAIDPEVAPYDVAPVSALVANSYLPQRIAASVMRVFGAGALVLAGVGLYGVLSFAVGQRTREIGVRVALGATRGDVIRLVLGQSARLVALGLVLGLALAAFGARAAGALLFGVQPIDPASYAGTAVVLVLVGLAASYAPARRALGVDPAVALRSE